MEEKIFKSVEKTSEKPCEKGVLCDPESLFECLEKCKKCKKII